MKIDLPLLDDISDSDLRVLSRSVVKVAARIAEGSLTARDLARRIDAILMEPASHDDATVRMDYTVAPETAPQLYRSNLNIQPSEFLQSVYGNWLAAGAVFQPTIRKIDKGLMKALDKEFTGRRDQLRALLPTKSDAVTRHLEELVGGTIQPDQRKRLIKVGRTVRVAQRQLTIG